MGGRLDIYALKTQLESRINEIKSLLPAGAVISTEAMNQRSPPPVYGFTLESDTHSRRALRIRPQTDGRHRSRARPDAARPWAWAWAHRWGGPPAVAVMGGFAAGLPLLLVVLPALMRRICRRRDMFALIPLCPLHAFSVPSPAITRQPFYGRKRIKKLTEYERHPRKKQ